MLYGCIYQKSLFKGTQHAYIASYYPYVYEIQQNLDAFEQYFLVLKAVSDSLTSTTQLLSSSTNLLRPLFNFFGTKKTLMKFERKA